MLRFRILHRGTVTLLREAQGAALLFFVVTGVLALRRFRPATIGVAAAATA